MNEVAVGRLIRPRGNRGELIAEIYSTQPGRAEKLKQVTLDRNGTRQSFAIEEFWEHDGKPVFKFAAIDSIDEAQNWIGADILVPESERAQPESGEYSHADLIGCEVIGVGIVTAIEEYGGPPLLKVQAADGHEILIPFANAICREIDIKAKQIRAELPEGLLDLQ
jgi:16S rRNA processing protein RimM